MDTRLKAGAVVLLLVLLSSLLFTPSALAQVETIGGFVVKVARAAGFDVPVPADALRTLVEQRLITRPLANVLAPQLGTELTRGMLSRILIDVMRLDAELVRARTADIVDFLARRGIISPGPAGSLVTVEEVTAILANPTVAAAIAAAIVPPLVPVVVVPAAVPLVIGVAAAAAAAGAAFAPASP